MLIYSTFQAKKANFDASHELEELLLEDNPLKAKARKANQDNLSAEMRQMEEQYVQHSLVQTLVLKLLRADLLHMTLRKCSDVRTTPITSTSSLLRRERRQAWHLLDQEPLPTTSVARMELLLLVILSMEGTLTLFAQRN